jgi:hypothetical protein
VTAVGRRSGQSGAKTGLAGDTPRAFRVNVIPGRGDSFGLRLEESYDGGGRTLTAPVTTVSASQVGRVVDALFSAVRLSGHAPSVLAFNRKTPIRIGEPEGVRLALILLATQPVAKHERVRALVAGVNSMSIEETYYWYSKCIGGDAQRARKALRVLLAD